MTASHTPIMRNRCRRPRSSTAPSVTYPLRR